MLPCPSPKQGTTQARKPVQAAILCPGVLEPTTGTNTLSGRDSTRAAQRVEISGVALLIRHSIALASFFALAEAEMLARHPGVFQGFAERDRDDILSRLQTSLAYLRAQTGVEVLQFHRADFRNLVRLQDIARHGDDVSKRRPIVVAAIRSGRSQRGLELGPSGALLRGTAPVMRGRVLLGFIEVGLSVNPLLDLPGPRSAARSARRMWMAPHGPSIATSWFCVSPASLASSSPLARFGSR